MKRQAVLNFLMLYNVAHACNHTVIIINIYQVPSLIIDNIIGWATTISCNNGYSIAHGFKTHNAQALLVGSNEH